MGDQPSPNAQQPPPMNSHSARTSIHGERTIDPYRKPLANIFNLFHIRVNLFHTAMSTFILLPPMGRKKRATLEE